MGGRRALSASGRGCPARTAFDTHRHAAADSDAARAALRARGVRLPARARVRGTCRAAVLTGFSSRSGLPSPRPAQAPTGRNLRAFAASRACRNATPAPHAADWRVEAPEGAPVRPYLLLVPCYKYWAPRWRWARRPRPQPWRRSAATGHQPARNERDAVRQLHTQGGLLAPSCARLLWCGFSQQAEQGKKKKCAKNHTTEDAGTARACAPIPSPRPPPRARRRGQSRAGGRRAARARARAHARRRRRRPAPFSSAGRRCEGEAPAWLGDLRAPGLAAGGGQGCVRTAWAPRALHALRRGQRRGSRGQACPQPKI